MKRIPTISKMLLILTLFFFIVAIVMKLKEDVFLYLVNQTNEKFAVEIIRNNQIIYQDTIAQQLVMDNYFFYDGNVNLKLTAKGLIDSNNIIVAEIPRPSIFAKNIILSFENNDSIFKIVVEKRWIRPVFQ